MKMEMEGKKVIKLSVHKNKKETFYHEILLSNKFHQENMYIPHIIFSLKLLFR